MFRKLDQKSQKLIEAEWDVLAPIRLDQIATGADITYRHVLIPAMLALIPEKCAEFALDAGCGVGFFTNILADHAIKTVGVDSSAGSIEIASANFGTRATFVCSTLENHAQTNQAVYDLAIANMVLMDVLDLGLFLASVHRTLRPEGVLVFSITHPCFWPRYYGYEQEKWYRYDKELIIESPFRITNDPNLPLSSTHIHRPLQAYITSLTQAGFEIEKLYEPMPSPDVEVHYPFPWTGPRYLIGSCQIGRR
jgi:2-polyprenyl-3-methyl-5-hydroxy-6-metoxy-1,4-benzoquinol methylase